MADFTQIQILLLQKALLKTALSPSKMEKLDLEDHGKVLQRMDGITSLAPRKTLTFRLSQLPNF